MKIRHEIARRKASAEPIACDGGALVAIGSGDLGDDALVETLYNARVAYRKTYPYRGEITLDTTRTWLQNRAIGDPGTIVFRVIGPDGKMVGVVGYTGCLGSDGAVELYNVLRTAPGVHPGLMTKAVRGLLLWAYDTLAAKHVWLRVLADNARAVRFYWKMGFAVKSATPIFHAKDGSYAVLCNGDERIPTALLLRGEHKGRDSCATAF